VEVVFLVIEVLLMPEALVNVSDNYNRSKVMLFLIYQGRYEDWNDYGIDKYKKTLLIPIKIGMSKIFGYMLENLLNL